MEVSMASSPSLSELQEQRTSLLAQIAALQPFRPGSLTARYRRCGKPSCHCAREGDPGHGPSWSLTRTVHGKTVTKIIPADEVNTTQQQIERYHEAQRLYQELTEVNVQICDALLERESDQDSASGGGKKGGS
jgi:hypothetical protein